MGRIPLGYVAKTAVVKSWRRLATDCGGPMRALTLRAGHVAIFHKIRLPNPSGCKTKGLELLKGHFDYAGQHLDIGAQGDPWTLPAPSERFAYWLHSFDWLTDLAASGEAAAPVRARFLVDRWINVFGDWNAYAWDNDILANRLFSWLSVWTGQLSIDSMSALAEKRRGSVLRQMKRLRSTYKRTPEGLPRLKAAAVLALGGLYIAEKPEGFLDRGLDWLNDEVELQILPDGGHITRSPAAAVQALHILTTLDKALETRDIDGSKILGRAIDRLRHVVPFFQMPDRGLTSFNGSGEGDKSFISKLLKHTDFEAKPFVYCPHTGYQKIEQNGTVMMVDTGVTSPEKFDHDAHLAPLSFELATPAGRLFVNCGWSEEQPASWREMMRATAAHTTLTLNDNSAGKIVNEGLAGKVLGKVIERSSGDVKAARKDQPTGVWLEMSHDGYLDTTGLTHRRRLYVKNTGLDVRGEEGLLVPIGSAPLSRDQIPFDIRFHLHPSVRATLAQDLQSALLIQPGQMGWRFRTDGGPMKIEPSVYLGAGNRPVKTQQIVISGVAFADSDGETSSNRVRWSLRCLESRKK